MSKILTDEELLSIIKAAITGEQIDDRETYKRFLGDLAVVVTDYFGGEPGTVDYEEEEYYVAIRINDSVPCDGGIYKGYDTDVSWVDGKEDEEHCDSSAIYDLK